MRLPITFRGGLLPHDGRPTLMLADVLDKKLPAPPESADWLSDVPPYAWGMLGNDKLGDCTVAGLAHKRIGDVWSNQGSILEVTTDQVISFYENFGYRPDDPDSDQGAVCQQVLETWQKKGFLGERPLAFARINVRNKTEIMQAISTFGQLYTGFNVPQSAMEQFNAGKPWTVVPGSPSIGGHCITLGGYDLERVKGVTWGVVQEMTWEFVLKQFTDLYAVIGKDDIDPKTGRNRLGLDANALGKAFAALTSRGLYAGREA